MSSALLSAANNTHPQWWKDPGLRKLNFWLSVLQLGSVLSGYDGSLMNGFFSVADFLSDMGNPDANTQGLLIAGISLGSIVSLPFCGWWADKRGRKEPQMVGCVVTIAGVLLQTFYIHTWGFFGARFLVGAGSIATMTIGSVHVIELAHPKQSSQHAALFGSNYFVGAILAAWITFGSLNIGSNWNWRLPSLFQGLPTLIQLLLLWFTPESPRWLLSVGRAEDAHKTLAKYHANGAQDDDLVLLELAEITTSLDSAKANKSESFRQFMRTPGNRKRFVLLSFVAVFIQWCGNGIISYYLAPILATVGITSAAQQQGINGGLQIWSFGWALYASFSVQRWKRRHLWLASTFGMLVSYTIFTALSAVYAKNGSKSIGGASIAFLFLFNASYSLAGTALCYLYPLEILPQGLRATGMAYQLFLDYAAIFFNQYVNPIAFDAIAWKYYLVYIVILALSLVFIYYYFPETAGLSVEEAALVCDGLEAVEALKAQVEDNKNLAGDGLNDKAFEANIYEREVGAVLLA